MSGFFTAHRILAFVVLIAAGAWIATGEFAAVGSEEAHAGAPETAATPEAEAAPLRTVAAVVPTFFEHAREIRIAGATEADKLAVLAARSDGIVEALGVVQGQEIAGDALVMKLVGPDVTASVATAEASLEQASQQLDVGMKLYARGSLPELELTNRRAAKAAAESALSQARSAEDRLLLKAPFNGVVDSVQVELGEWVQTGMPIATVLSLDPILVKAEVTEHDVGFISVGEQALVRLVDGNELPGTIRHVAKQASPATRTFVVEVVLPNADRKIASGMTAEVRLYAQKQPAVLVPRSVITISDEGQIGLRVVGPDNVAQFAPVAIIDDTEAGTIVTGVPEGIRVIVAGQDLVRNGESVTVTEVSQ